MVPVRDGCWVVRAEHHRGDLRVEVRPVVAGPDGPEVGAPAYVWAEDTWGAAHLPAHLQAAVDAACEKAQHYHCREPHYVAQPRHVEMGGEGR